MAVKAKAQSILKRAHRDSEQVEEKLSVEETRQRGRTNLNAALLGKYRNGDEEEHGAHHTNDTASSVRDVGRGCESPSVGGPSKDVLALKSELRAAVRKDVGVHAVLKKLEKLNVDIELLQQTGIGQCVNALTKHLAGAATTDDAVAPLARQLVAKWRNSVQKQRISVSNVANAIERALWNDVITDEKDDGDDALETYTDRIEVIAQALAVDNDLRRVALAGAPADDIMERALSAGDDESE